MKQIKIILISILFLFVQLKTNAQRFKAGIDLGFVASEVYGSDIVPDSDAWNDASFRKAGFMLGGNVGTALGERTLLQMEINYIQKGTQQNGDSTGFGFYKFSFNYVEVPLLVKYRLHLKGQKTNGFEIHGGVSAAMMIKSKAQGANFYTIDDYSYLNRTDISLLAGFGYNFYEHFNLSFRYSNSVIPVFSRLNSPLYFAQAFNVGNNMVLHFILQYTFEAKKNKQIAEESN